MGVCHRFRWAATAAYVGAPGVEDADGGADDDGDDGDGGVSASGDLSVGGSLASLSFSSLC